MGKSENIIKFEQALENSEEKRKEFEAAFNKILDEKSAKSDGEAIRKAAKELGFDISIEEFERSFADKQYMEDDELDKVSGGWCALDHSCFTAFCHDSKDSENDACFKDYICFSMEKSDERRCDISLF